MELGRKILQELSHGTSYYDLLSRREDEIEKIEKILAKGKVPSVFRLHTREYEISPKSPEDYLALIGLLDVKKTKYIALKDIVELVVGYPHTYHPVKEKIGEILREASKENIKKQKKLDPSLFRALCTLMCRNTKCMAEAVILPWIREGMTNTAALVLSRVIMKSSSEREYMEEFLERLMEESESSVTFILIVSVLIKKIKFGKPTVEKIEKYIFDTGSEVERSLAWNKLVLAFVRGYKDAADLRRVEERYREIERESKLTEIEKEILREIEGSVTEEKC